MTAGDGFRTRDPYLGKTERQFRIQNPWKSGSGHLLTPNFDVDRLNIDGGMSQGEKTVRQSRESTLASPEVLAMGRPPQQSGPSTPDNGA